ncbi:hypothetical protein IAG25_40335 [Caballeronia sp. EK]|nr:hypothetical protein [Caballeronia sp. EK]
MAASTRREWSGIVIKLLIPQFKGTALSALTRRDIKKWLAVSTLRAPSRYRISVSRTLQLPTVVVCKFIA